MDEKNKLNADFLKKVHRRSRHQERVDEIGKLIAGYVPRVEKVYLDEVGNYTFVVVEFKGGAISVRNVTANSFVAILEELVKLLNGGYYREVEYYLEMKKHYGDEDEPKALKDIQFRLRDLKGESGYAIVVTSYFNSYGRNAFVNNVIADLEEARYVHRSLERADRISYTIIDLETFAPIF
ncbi:MAG: hypothetical protein M0R38_10045 [Bacteroidia bacterium]|nr:hypothetical protein [Bacteroidia bacterium]